MKPDLNKLPSLFPPKKISSEEIKVSLLDLEYKDDFGDQDWTQISDETYRKNHDGFFIMDHKILASFIAGYLHFIYRDRESNTAERFTYFVEGKDFQKFCGVLSKNQVLFLVEAIDYLYLTDDSPTVDFCWDQNRIIVLNQMNPPD